MTKEITKAFILGEIQDKFKLRELTHDIFSFSETVVPTYNIEQHLLTWAIKKATVSITSATNFLFFTVPATERWLLRSYMVIYGMTGAIKGTGLYIQHRPPGNPDFIYLDLKAGQEISYLVTPENPVVLAPGNRLSYLIDTYVSTQDLSVYIDVQVEELR